MADFDMRWEDLGRPLANLRTWSMRKRPGAPSEDFEQRWEDLGRPLADLRKLIMADITYNLPKKTAEEKPGKTRNQGGQRKTRKREDHGKTRKWEDLPPVR